MVSFFESTSKNVKPKKHVKSPPKLIIPVQMKQRIIMPKGGIPKDYYASSSSQNPRPKSPRYIRNVEIAKPQKLDKEKIKNNMENMKQLLEKKIPLLERKWSKIDETFVSRNIKAKETKEKVLKMLSEGMRKCDISRKLIISSSLVTKISKSYER